MAQSKFWTQSNWESVLLLENCRPNNRKNLPGRMCQDHTWAESRVDLSFTQKRLNIDIAARGSLAVLFNAFQFSVNVYLKKEPIKSCYKNEIGVLATTTKNTTENLMKSAVALQWRKVWGELMWTYYDAGVSSFRVLLRRREGGSGGRVGGRQMELFSEKDRPFSPWASPVTHTHTPVTTILMDWLIGAWLL